MEVTGIDKDVVLMSVFMAMEGAFAYSAFLPSIMTIGTFVDSPAKVAMIRQGELVGTVFLAGLATITALIVKSIIPLVAGAMAGGLAIFVYERALQNAPVGSV
jgi:hypothetical protein